MQDLHALMKQFMITLTEDKGAMRLINLEDSRESYPLAEGSFQEGQVMAEELAYLLQIPCID